MLLLAGTGPLALGAFARLSVPLADGRYLLEIDLPSFVSVVLAFLVAFPPYIYGFVVGFLVLEDREQGTLSALVTSPLARAGYLRYRGLTAYVLSAVGVVLSVVLFDPAAVAPLALAGVAMVAALGGLAIALLFASLASDSIEGVAINKLLGLAVVLRRLPSSCFRSRSSTSPESIRSTGR
ncbi:hypothetical protein [Halalkalicoccus salilacus]|uniref:hypothetical protein n=1 Tax=Halalkalicoccus salilacus TaxID=3117459 RepID=UPI00300EBA14